MPQSKSVETAVFAGGCFWCMESAFKGQAGVKDVVSGYTGGHVENPGYEAVCSGTTGHAEAVRVTYDPNKISYWQLLEVFFTQIDPTDATGSFVDRGSQYRPGIFFQTPEQERLARAMIERLNASGIFDRPVATEVTKAAVFYPAEAYHQDYHKKNAVRYKFYRTASGREPFVKAFWDEDNRRILKEKPGEPGKPTPEGASGVSPGDGQLESDPVQ